MTASVTDSFQHYTSTTVVIIGAGFGGLCVALDLVRKNKCRDFIIIEKSAGVGGVWYDNNYPGCGVDVQSIVYSYSFEQSSNWKYELPKQKEVLTYLTDLAQKYKLYQHIRFGCTVTEANWNDDVRHWEIKIQPALGGREAEIHQEYTITSDVLISAVGQLSEPQLPDIPGLDSFTGKLMHSSRWDRAYDLRDKNVAVIGTGCSAVQIVPEIAEMASKVTVFQRQPHWILPRGNSEISKATQTLYRWLPWIQHFRRRQCVSENEEGHSAQAYHGGKENLQLEQTALEMMREQLPGQAELWEKLTPKYPLGCKRLVASDHFLPALGRDNVELETRAIQCVQDKTVFVQSENDQSIDALCKDFDAIICATGFRTTQFLHSVRVTGRNSRSLREVWQDGAYAYLGVSVPDMPNFGMIMGPNTALLHNSFVLMIEAQSAYISGMIGAVLAAKRGGAAISLSPRADITNSYNIWLQKELKKFAVAGNGCTNWYRTKGGRITNLWPARALDYHKRLEYVNYDEFEVEVRQADGKTYKPRLRPHHAATAWEKPGTLDKLFPSLLVVCGVSGIALLSLRWLVKYGNSQ